MKSIIPLKLFLLVFAAVTAACIWYAAISENHHDLLTIAFLDIGQGDAIYIQAPNGNDIIIDGGPGRVLLGALGKVVPFYKRSVGAILVTNPDADHYSGFIDLLDRYKVGMEFEPGTISNTPTHILFEHRLEDHHVPKLLVQRGMTIMLDQKDNVYLSILFPDRDVSKFSSNDGSVVAKLVFGNTSVMLQGDSTAVIEHYLVGLDGPSGLLRADILKAGHHGSKTSSSDEYVKTVAPTYAIISAGLNNRYGHPNQETIDTLNKYHVKILKTMDLGTIIFRSNGQTFRQK